jgi:aryl-alcohol dehydrogenase-like predicted oxidoreductase
MTKTKLGNSGLEVSRLCLGTDSLGSKIDRETSFRLLDTFRENGGTFIDTGNFYAAWHPGCVGGESESVIGAWLKERGCRDEMVVATKVGFDYPGCEGGLSAAELERECEKSLGRLGTEWIDLYYAHRDDFAVEQEETMGAFERLRSAGKIRAAAASNLKVWRIGQANTVARLNGWQGFVAVQQRHTYFRPRHGADFGPQIVVGEELKDYCASQGVSLIAYSVLLQGAYTREERAVPAQYAGPEADERLAALRHVAGEAGVSVNQTILAWLLGGSPAAIPIIAGSRPEQLLESIGALNVRLTEEQRRTLDTAGNPDVKQAWLR